MTPIITAIVLTVPPGIVNLLGVLVLLIYMLVQHTNAMIARAKYNEFM